MKYINVVKGAGRKRTAKRSYSKSTVQRSTALKAMFASSKSSIRPISVEFPNNVLVSIPHP